MSDTSEPKKKGLRKTILGVLLGTAVISSGLTAFFMRGSEKSSKSGAYDDERKASLTYRIGSETNSILPASVFDLEKSANLKTMDLDQLNQYSFFMDKCNHYLKILCNDPTDSEKYKTGGIIDPLKRFGVMTDEFLEDLRTAEDKVLNAKGSKKGIHDYLILQNIGEYLKGIKGKIKSGGSAAERFDIVGKLIKLATKNSSGAKNETVFRTEGPKRGRIVDDF